MMKKKVVSSSRRLVVDVVEDVEFFSEWVSQIVETLSFL